MPEERTRFAPLGGWWSDALVALGFLTRLPVGVGVGAIGGDLASAARAFPLAGLLVGVLSALAYALAVKLGLTALLAGALAVAAGIAVTGALHEDGLADFADGLGARGGPAAKLAAMRDSHLGVFGALALMLGLLLRVVALAALTEPGAVACGLIAAHAGSRALLPWIMQRETPARPDGLAVAAGRPGNGAVIAAMVLGFVIMLLAVGFWPAVLAALLAAVASWLAALLARRQVGGVTGDVLGAIQQVAEIVILLSLVASR
jgi:adenosylcobinamide-GDP ribazoletransferase